MKGFLKKKWHGLPIGIIASALIASAVIAAVLITVVQPITQTITTPPGPEPGEEIIAAPIGLSSVDAGGAFAFTVSDPVSVTTGAASRTLRATLADPSGSYSNFIVRIILASKPAGSSLVVGTANLTISSGFLTTSLVLDAVGDYTFDQEVLGTAGAAGTAVVNLTFTLEN